VYERSGRLVKGVFIYHTRKEAESCNTLVTTGAHERKKIVPMAYNTPDRTDGTAPLSVTP
jgi:hypothetical protein